MLSPLQLLRVLQNLEDEHGRLRTERWGARTLDLDIIDYQGVTSEDERLTLPHPRASERAFVLLPWSLVAPSAELSGVGEVVVLADYAPDRDGVKEIYPDWAGSSHSETEAGTGAIPLPRWSAISRPPIPPRVLDDPHELHPTGEISQVDKHSSPLPPATEEANSPQAAPLPVPPAHSSSPVPAVSSLPLPRLNSDHPQAAVVLDEEPAEISGKPLSMPPTSGAADTGIAPQGSDTSELAKKPKKKSLWQRIKTFFVGEKADPEQFLAHFEQESHLTEPAEGSEHSWQALPNTSAPGSAPSPAPTAGLEKTTENLKAPAEQVPGRPEVGTVSGPAETSGGEQADFSEPEKSPEEAAAEEPTDSIEYGSGRHAGRLVTGPIPVPEESPQPLPLDISASQVSGTGGSAVEEESRVERKSILRPTTTGAVPVVKPETDRTEQPTEAFNPLQDSE